MLRVSFDNYMYTKFIYVCAHVYVCELALQWKLEKLYIYEDVVLLKFTTLFLAETELMYAWYLGMMQSQIRYQSNSLHTLPPSGRCYRRLELYQVYLEINLMDTSTCKGCWCILISLSGSGQTVFERCFSKYNAINFLYQNTMLKFVSSINLIKVDNIAAECSTHGDRYTMCVHNLCIRRCIYFFSLRISHMSLQVLRPGDICLLSTLTSFGILITLQCSIGDPSIMSPMRVN